MAHRHIGGPGQSAGRVGTHWSTPTAASIICLPHMPRLRTSGPYCIGMYRLSRAQRPWQSTPSTRCTSTQYTLHDPRRDTKHSQARSGRSRSTHSANQKGRSVSHGPTQVVATKPLGPVVTTLTFADVKRLQERFLRVDAETKRHSEELAKLKAENMAQKAQIEEQAAQLATHAARHATTQLVLDEQARVQAQAAEDRQVMKANIAQAIALLTQAASTAAPSAPTPHNPQQN